MSAASDVEKIEKSESGEMDESGTPGETPAAEPQHADPNDALQAENPAPCSTLPVQQEQCEKIQRSNDNASTAAPVPPEGSHVDAPPATLFKTPMFVAPTRLVMKQKTGSAAKAFGDKSAPKKVSEVTGDAVVTPENEPENKPTKEEEKTQKYATPTQQKPQNAPIPYKEPVWSGLCTENYSFEVIKNGTVIDTQDLKTKSFYVFGRLPSCDVMMEHPSLSRYHAVVQYCATENAKHPVGWYLYDLDSTHGTWVNKCKVKPRVYIRLRVGFVVKLGGSSRLHILQGPSDDQDEESALSVQELKQQREKQKKEAEVLRQAELTEAENQQQLMEKQAMDSTGCSWGMDESEEEISADNPFALDPVPQNEDLYIEDPKKALRGFFEREGYDLPEYEVLDDGRGKYKCRVELPIYGPTGEAIMAEVTVSGKKKDAVAACALEGCRLLDRHGELRKATHESRARKKKNWEENDYYDSDDDTFLDRTGDIEKKRSQRMKRVSNKSEKAETYESLMEKLSAIDKQITDIETQLQQAKEKTMELENEGLDVFDVYMMSLKSGMMDTQTRTKLKRQMFDLKQEKMKLERLANIAKPALPGVAKSWNSGKLGVVYGKMKGPTKGTVKITKPQHKPTPHVTADTDDMIVEEDEDEDEETATKETTSKSSSKSATNPDSTVMSKSKRKNVDKTKTFQQTSQSESDILHLKCDKVVVSSSLSLSPQMTEDKTDINVDNGGSTSMDKSSKERIDMTVMPQNDPPKTTSDIVPQMAAPDSGPVTKKRKSQKPPTAPDYKDMDDADYAVWLPPVGQTGDGKTSLNAKYGY